MSGELLCALICENSRGLLARDAIVQIQREVSGKQRGCFFPEIGHFCPFCFQNRLKREGSGEPGSRRVAAGGSSGGWVGHPSWGDGRKNSLVLGILRGCCVIMEGVWSLGAESKVGRKDLLRLAHVRQGWFVFRPFISASWLSFFYFKEFSCSLLTKWCANKSRLGGWEDSAFFRVLTLRRKCQLHLSAVVGLGCHCRG